MSYYTDVRFNWHSEDESITTDMLLAEARAFLGRFDHYAVDDIMESLTKLFRTLHVSIKGMFATDFTPLFLALSRKFPSVRLDICGLGEDFADIWARRFLGGKLIFKRGPFDQ